jgi:hypothetical protein
MVFAVMNDALPLGRRRVGLVLFSGVGGCLYREGARAIGRITVWFFGTWLKRVGSNLRPQILVG